VADGETSEPSWNSANSVSDAIKVTILQQNDAAMTSITTTGCSAVETLFIGIFRKRIHASDSATGEIRLHGVEIVTRGTIL
jgi:hypothetical protein